MPTLQNLYVRTAIYRIGLGQTAEFEGAVEDAGEHRPVEAAGVGVAEGGVIAAEEGDLVGQKVLGRVREGVGGAPLDNALIEQVGEVAVPGDLAEADDDADFGQRGDLGREVRGAVADLLGRRFVAGRGAADDGADPDLAELEAVVATGGGGLAGEAEFVEDGVHKVSGAVTGKWAAGPVGAVGPGSEAEDEDAGLGITEAGNGFGPVFLVAEGLAAGFTDTADVGDKARAAGAICNALLQRIEDGEGMFDDKPLGAHEWIPWYRALLFCNRPSMITLVGQAYKSSAILIAPNDVCGV